MSDVVLIELLATNCGKQIGQITLNSERSLNALSIDMIRMISPQLNLWAQNENVVAVVLKGQGSKAFCAGGDVVSLYREMVAAQGDYSQQIQSYFTEEYRLDYQIRQYSKPILVLGRGIVMGGGLGLLSGASHRVVTETSRIAMPEITIGLFPDVGATWFLPKMPKGCGLFLGLTGAAINGTDALYCGLADSLLADESLDRVIAGLAELAWSTDVKNNHQSVSDWLAEHQLAVEQQPTSMLKKHQTLIESLTGHDDLASIVSAITTVDSDDKWLTRAKQTLLNGSPISAHLVYRQMAEADDLTEAECFQKELSMAVKCGQFGEFQEGVRALLIDKDNQPNWRFKSVEDVDLETIDWFFTPRWIESKHPLHNLKP